MQPKVVDTISLIEGLVLNCNSQNISSHLGTDFRVLEVLYVKKCPTTTLPSPKALVHCRDYNTRPSMQCSNTLLEYISYLNHFIFVSDTILTLSLLATTSYCQSCDEEYDALRCIYNVYCYNDYRLRNSFYVYRVQDYSTGIVQNTLAPSCENSIYVQGHRIQPVYLIYKASKSNNENIIPECYDQGSCEIIISLNISFNEYHHIPTLNRMEGLASLNISRNYITEALLSNQNELPSLVEIDFSHNMIKKIVVKPEENLFTNLKTINLSYNYLVKLQEAIFDPFENLQFLDLSHNFINTLTPFTFEGMKNLLYLNISHNRISDINSSLFRFNNLKTLELSHNRLADIKQVDFEKLINLETLDLSSNSILVIEKKVFSNLQRLVYLDLSNNLLEVIEKEIFANLPNLISINFSMNHFKHLPISIFRGKRISTFSIHENYLEGSLTKGVFEGLYLVTELDLSFQYLSALEDFAFIGLNHLETLLLNNNNLNFLSKKSFRTLHNLHNLDLSNNKISNIEFDKDDLNSLLSLSLRNNLLIQIEGHHFQGLSLLQFLDLSNNNISKLESNAFISLKELINFEISNNPLSGTLKKNTFEGLNSLPNLDISCSLLNIIQNNSLSGMTQLKTLNISHSKVRELGYNAFFHTGAIEVLDISYNELDIFLLNTTELSRVETLLLNNNLLTFIASETLRGMSRLLKIILASNIISRIEITAFNHQKDLRVLDLSFNSQLIFNVTIIKTMKTLNNLNLSGIKNKLTFENAGDVLLSYLQITHLEVSDIKIIRLNELIHLDCLILSNNNITKLEVGAFTNLTKLRNLDLSYNKLSFIQPGVFKDNTLLYNLNISHNFLTALSYGIFRGLVYLDTLDISYNKVTDLQSERFYEVRSLRVIIADYNMINSVNTEAFVGTSLRTLSIGGNPLPCEMLVNLKKYSVPFEITAVILNEKSNDENVDGVTCNSNGYTRSSRNESSKRFMENDNTLVEIKDILLNFSAKYNEKRDNANTMMVNNDTHVLIGIARNIENAAVNIYNNSSPLSNITSTFVQENDRTNVLLEKILKVLSINAKRATITPVITGNITNENLTIYINKIRSEIENMVALERQNMIRDVEKKIDIINARIDSISKELPKHEKFVASEIPKQSKSLFTETCVTLILAILVCLILYKFYKSRQYLRNRLSISTRELPGAMENSTL